MLRSQRILNAWIAHRELKNFNPPISMNNTKFEYFYRDADNYKSSVHSFVLPGIITHEQWDAIYAEDFVPELLGFPSLQEELQALDIEDNINSSGDYDPYGPEGSDHLYHEWLEIGCTDEEVTDNRTLEQFLAQFKAYVDSGWVKL